MHTMIVRRVLVGVVGRLAVACASELNPGEVARLRSNPPADITHAADDESDAITAGYTHSCALLDDGTVRCWGAHSCALFDERTVHRWGDNAYRQLGGGTTRFSPIPVAVSGLTDVVAIDAGGFHSCAMLGDGSVDCWGGNFYGQVGDGSEPLGEGSVQLVTTPQPVTGLR